MVVGKLLTGECPRKEKSAMSQLLEFAAAVVRNLPDDVDMQPWIQNQQALAKALREALCPPRWRVEVDGTIVWCGLKVNRSRTPSQAIRATGRVEYLNDAVVASMPHVTEEEVELRFFPLKVVTSASDYQKAIEDRGLISDPMAVVAANEADPAFADAHPNGTQWVDVNGNHCYLAFRCWLDKRFVYVNRNENDWLDHWWVAGVVPRK